MRTKPRSTVLAVALLMAALGAHAQSPGQSGSQGTTEGTTQEQGTTQQSTTQGAGQAGGSTASGAGDTAKALSKADQKILRDMAMANMAEVEAGRLAQTKAQSDQVKTFAQQMIDDHTKALDDVKQVAQAKGVTLPTELDKAHKDKADKLAALSGEQFDRTYMAQAGVLDHRSTHRMLRRAERRATDPDVKALVARTMPAVNQHLQSAQQLRGGQSATMGGGAGGTTGSGSGTGTTGGDMTGGSTSGRGTSGSGTSGSGSSGSGTSGSGTSGSGTTGGTTTDPTTDQQGTQDDKN